MKNIPSHPLIGLTSDRYEHPFDRKALDSLNKTPGLSRVFKAINEYGLDRLFRFRCLANSLRVESNNFPELYQSFYQAIEILDINPAPTFYLSHGEGYIRSFTIGVNQPIVVLNMDGVTQLECSELVFLLGHELGHIKSQHLLYQQAAIILPVLGRFIANSTLGLGGLATNGLELALYQWVMMAKLTCDREGLLACQDLEVALSTLIKLAGVPITVLTTNPKAIVESFEKQAREFGEYNLDNLDKITKIFSFLENMKPWAILRAAELLKWVDSGEYEAVRSGLPLAPSSAVNPIENMGNTETPLELPEDWDFLQSW